MAVQSYYEKYENKIGSFFEKYGTFVSKYPIFILTGCILVNCCLGMGLAMVEFERDVEKLYTPMNSKAAGDRGTIKQSFGDKTGTNFYAKSAPDVGSYGEVIILSKNGENMLDTKYFTEIENIHNEILTSVTFEDNEQTYSYRDVCALRNEKCVVTGDILLSANFQMMASLNNITYPVFGTEMISFVFGNITITKNLLNSATMVKMHYNLRQDTQVKRTLAKNWKMTFINRLNCVNRNLTEVLYATSDSLNAELEKNSQGDIISFSLTFALMIIYSSLATIGGNCVSDRSHIGRAGVVATLLAILGSFGLVSACGVKVSTIVGVMPFLIIGIGIDNMFILVSGLADASALETIKEKMKFTMRSSGVAVTITTVTDFLAFVIGASSSFYSVRIFCIYTGVAVIFCYKNQLTFIMPCLVLHERRAASKRSCATCLPIKSRTELINEGRSNCYTLCCGGATATKRNHTANPIEKYPIMTLQKLIVLKPVKVIILLLFTTYLCFSIWGAINLKRGLDLSKLVSGDSYFYRYMVADRDHFISEYLVSFVIPTQKSYSDSDTQYSIHSMLTKAKVDPDIQSSFEINWLSEFKNSEFYNSSSETNFVKNLAQFLKFRPDLSNDVVFDYTGTRIIASRFYVFSKNLQNPISKERQMQNMRVIAESCRLSAIAFSPRLYSLSNMYIFCPIL